MGEMCELIGMVKEDKDNFQLIKDKFEPLINKYVRLLFRDEKEDVYAELVAALWEAVVTITFYDNDGQVVNYIATALRNKYLELYRISRRYHDSMVGMDKNEIETVTALDSAYEDILIRESINKIYDTLSGNKREIFRLVFMEELSDMEVACRLQVSRQYVHRIKNCYAEMIKNKVIF